MRVLIYDTSGVESYYDFKPDVPFHSHIRHLFLNLLEYNHEISGLVGGKNEGVGKADSRSFEEGGDTLSQHFSLQESKGGHWIENSMDPLLTEDVVLLFKLKPLVGYVQAVESLIRRQERDKERENAIQAVTSIRDHIQNQIQLTMSTNNNNYNSGSGDDAGERTRHDRLNEELDHLQTHIKLLMVCERKKDQHVFISSDIISRIVKIIFHYRSVNSLEILVDYLYFNNRSTKPTNVLTTSNNGISTNNNNNNNKSNDLETTIDGSDSISLFTLVDQAIKTVSKEQNQNFYIYLLKPVNAQQQQTNAIIDQQSIIITNTIKLINNMFLLASNPVNYLSKLHTDNVLNTIREIAINDNSIANTEEYIKLRNNLMRELQKQRIQTIHLDKLQHQTMFNDLWNAALSPYPFNSRIVSSKWMLLGFRSPNPIDDLRLTGILALRNLAYLAKHHQPLLQHLLVTQTTRESTASSEQPNQEENVDAEGDTSSSYPIAAIGISITYNLSQLFRIGKGETTSTSNKSIWDIAFSDKDWFDKLYISTLALFEAIWSNKAHDYIDFPEIMHYTKNIIDYIVQQLPKSIDEAQNILNQILVTKESIPTIDFELTDSLVQRYQQLISLSQQQQQQQPTSTTQNDETTSNSSDNTSTLDRKESTDKPSQILLEMRNEFSSNKLTKFFGENVDPRVHSKHYQFAPQPQNVSQNKLKNFFGENNTPTSPVLSDSSDMSGNEQDDLDEEKGRIKKRAMEKRNHRLHVFFGEWFETEQVEYSERIRSSVMINPDSTDENSGGEALSPNSLRKLSSSVQPDNVRINKLNKFFGERVPVSKPVGSLSQSTNSTNSLNKSGGSNPSSPRSVSDSEDNQPDSATSPSSPEEVKSNFKAQKVLGERINVKKEREAVNFAPQPAHVREHKLHKLFGEMVPTQKLPPPQESSSSSKKNTFWRKGTSANKSNYHSTVVIPLSSSLPSTPFKLPESSLNSSPAKLTAPSSLLNPQPQQQEVEEVKDVKEVEVNIVDQQQPVEIVKEIVVEPSTSLVKEEQDSKPQSNSCRASINSSISQLSEEFEFDDQELTEEEIIKQRHRSSHRLQVFFGERFDVDSVVYNHKFLTSPDSSNSLSVSPQPDNVKTYKLKKKFGKLPELSELRSSSDSIEGSSPRNSTIVQQTTTTTTNNSNNTNSPPLKPRSSSSSKVMERPLLERSLSVSQAINIFNTIISNQQPNSPSTSFLSTSQSITNNTINTPNRTRSSSSGSTNSLSNSGSITPPTNVDTTHQQQYNTLSTSMPNQEINRTRREFKIQKMFGERMNIEQESTRYAINQQPSTVKVDKLINIFGERVSFSQRPSGSDSPANNNLSASNLNQ